MTGLEEFRNMNIKALINDFFYGNRLTAVVRIILGVLFLLSGLSKVLDVGEFSKIIMNYGIIPDWLVPYPAILLPFLEIIIGINFIIGFKIKASSLISILLMIFFIVIISYALATGKSFDCGCFNFSKLGFALNEKLSYKLIIRNIILLLFFILIFRLKRYRISIESLTEKISLENIE